MLWSGIWLWRLGTLHMWEGVYEFVYSFMNELNITEIAGWPVLAEVPHSRSQVYLIQPRVS